MIELPACQHRGGELPEGSGRVVCRSRWILKGAEDGTVSPGFCSEKCWCPDRPNPTGEPSTGELVNQRITGGACEHLGEVLRSDPVTLNCGRQALSAVYRCNHAECGPETTLLFGTLHGKPVCGPKCSGWKPRGAKFTPQPGDPAAGVAIGSYHWPRLIALQIAIIRDHCGPVPILVSDDCTEGWTPDGQGVPGSRFELLRTLCAQHPDVTLRWNNGRAGHLWGDTFTIRHGVLWGKERGLRAVAKFSQRFILTVPRWLQTYSRELLDGDLATLSQRCRHAHPSGKGHYLFGIRSEALLLNVAKWTTPEVLWMLDPESGQIGGENTTTDAARKAGEFGRWRLFGPDRFGRHSGVLWHHAGHSPAENAACARAYQGLAARYGLKLDSDFQCGSPASSYTELSPHLGG
jgi:hypothetical protein